MLATKSLEPAHLSERQQKPADFVALGNRPNVFLTPLAKLRPTQVAVGMRAVAAKCERIKSRKIKLGRLPQYLESRPIPSVIGPDDRLYIVDHHHMAVALLQLGICEAYTSVSRDLSDLAYGDFWPEMDRLGLAYPYDHHGDRLPHGEIPLALAGLRSDPFRDVAWSVREAGGYQKSSVPYAEFKWAQFFSTSVDPRLIERDYERAVGLALRLARSSSAARLPGFLECREAA